MKFILSIFTIILLSVTFAAAQELSREQKLQKVDELNKQIKQLEDNVISASAKDLKAAQKDGFSAVRLMPREKYDGKLTIRGGGAFYSFAHKSSEYGSGSDIGLEQNYLKVGFAGADYGFIYDLGEMPLADVSKEIIEVNFLATYKPPTNEPEIRVEQRKAREYDVNGIIYKSRVPNVIGHTYVLRSISFGDSDVLVAFKVQRKDTDGSLIIFWKLLENFEKPLIARS